MPDGRPWRIRSLAISDLRCWERLALELPPGLIVINGPNGAGKTSIIEAIVLATLGVSPRTAQLAELVRTGAPAVRVTGEFDVPPVRGPRSGGRSATRWGSAGSACRWMASACVS